MGLSEEHRRVHCFDAIALFRYSALSFNSSSRIHYDVDYCRSLGHRGLVVHVPLLAQALSSLAETVLPNRRVRRFKYRAMAPVFADEPFHTCAKSDGNGGLLLWIRDNDGNL